MKRIYLDANGSAPPIPEAKEAIKRVVDSIGNPSSSHEHGRIQRMLIDDVRMHVAHAAHALPKEVIFTSGASEANRLFVDALSKMAVAFDRPLRIAMSPYEHPSLFKPIVCNEQFHVSILPLDDQGCVILSPDIIDDIDVLIACHAHNETGIINPLEQWCRALPDHVLVMSDISQAFSRTNPLPSRVDVMSFSAQKMGGFAGAGGVIIRGNGKKLKAPWVGGGQERGFRPGTESTLALAALGAAAKYIDSSRVASYAQKELRDLLEQSLARIIDIKIIGEHAVRLPNTSAICFYQEDADTLRIACDLAGLSVGFGAACSGLAPEGSFALKRLGLGLNEERSTVRFSLSFETTPSDIEETIARLTTRVVLNHKSRA